MKRIEKIAQDNPGKTKFSEIIDLYSWFLENFQVQEHGLVEWIKIPANRTQAFDKAASFANAIFEVMMSCDNHTRLQFFLA